MPVPFYISSRGHGVWLNTTRRTDWDFRPDVAGGVQWQVEGRAARMNVILGRTPKATLSQAPPCSASDNVWTCTPPARMALMN